MTIEIDCQGRESWSRLLSDQLIYRQWFILSCTKPNWVTTPQVCSGIGWLTLENLQGTPTLFSGQRILIFSALPNPAQDGQVQFCYSSCFLLWTEIRVRKLAYSVIQTIPLLCFLIHLSLFRSLPWPPYMLQFRYIFLYCSCSSSFMLTVSMTANGLIWIEGLNPSLY